MKEFRIILYLHNFFEDCRSLSRIFINENIKSVSDLEDHICYVFGIKSPIYLSACYYYLPSSEDIRVLDKDEVVIVNRKEEYCCDNYEEDAAANILKKRRRCGHYIEAKKKEKRIKHKNKRVQTLVDAELNEESFLKLLPVEQTNVPVAEPKQLHKEKKKKKSEKEAEVELEENVNQQASNELTENEIMEPLNLNEQNVDCNKKNDDYEAATETVETHIALDNKDDDKMSVDMDGNEKNREEEEMPIIILNNYSLHTEDKIADNLLPQNEDTNKELEHCPNEKFNSNNSLTNEEKEADKSIDFTSMCRRRQFTVSDCLSRICSSNENESAIESDFSLIKPRRKRVRKHRKRNQQNKVDESSNNETIENEAPKRFPSPQGTPSLHIRFDSDNEKENVSNKEIVEEEEQNVEAQETESCENNLDAPLSESVIKSFPKLTKKPQATDVIGFKILKIAENYTPTISQYIAGKVLEYDAKEDLVYCEILYGKDELKEPNGKFSLNEEIEIEDTENCFKLSNLKEVRILFP